VPNVAARVQSTAGADEVVVTAHTRDLVRGAVRFESAGYHELKGVGRFELHRVVGLGNRPSAPGRGRIVDRAPVLALLRARWHEVRAGAGHAVVVHGDAGIGKSEVARALRLQCEAEGGTWLDVWCSAHHTVSALHPFTALLDSVLGADGDLVAGDLERIGLAGHAETLDLLRSGVSVAGSRARGSAPAVARERIFEAVRAVVRAARGDGPAVLLVEDVHWADPTTAELLGRLTAAPEPGVLLLITHRQGGGPAASGTTTIHLDPLAGQHVVQLAHDVAGAPLTDEISKVIVDRTDGVPLFASELTRMLIDTGAIIRRDEHYTLQDSLSSTWIPAQVQDSLMARLDALGSAKPLAQLAATIGRVFDHDLLADVDDSNDLDGRLTTMLNAHIVAPEQRPGSYAFTHALVRDVAYESLLRSTRRAHHRRIAAALVVRRRAGHEVAPELIVRHAEGADDAALAVRYWREVAARANERSATREAITSLRSAAALLDDLPPSTQRDREELGIMTSLGTALAAAHGYADPDAEASYVRAKALAATMPAAIELFPAVFGLLAFFTARGRFDEARAAGDQLLRSASEDSGLTVVATFSVGMIDLYEGDLPAALDRFTVGVDTYDPSTHHHLAYRYIFDPGVACHRALSVALVLAGRDEEAAEHARTAIDLATRLDHPFSLASAHAFAAVSWQLRGDRGVAEDHAAQAIALAEERGFTFWALMGHMVHGWALGEAGHAEALQKYQASGSVVLVPYLLGLLAQLGGPTDRDATIAREAIALARAHGETWYLPRLRAILDTAAEPLR
jgi:predicted ATPase